MHYDMQQYIYIIYTYIHTKYMYTIIYDIIYWYQLAHCAHIEGRNLIQTQTIQLQGLVSRSKQTNILIAILAGRNPCILSSMQLFLHIVHVIRARLTDSMQMNNQLISAKHKLRRSNLYRMAAPAPSAGALSHPGPLYERPSKDHTCDKIDSSYRKKKGKMEQQKHNKQGSSI